jgi:hypothetical protein
MRKVLEVKSTAARPGSRSVAAASRQACAADWRCPLSARQDPKASCAVVFSAPAQRGASASAGVPCSDWRPMTWKTQSCPLIEGERTPATCADVTMLITFTNVIGLAQAVSCEVAPGHPKAPPPISQCRCALVTLAPARRRRDPLQGSKYIHAGLPACLRSEATVCTYAMQTVSRSTHPRRHEQDTET